MQSIRTEKNRCDTDALGGLVRLLSFFRQKHCLLVEKKQLAMVFSVGENSQCSSIRADIKVNVQADRQTDRQTDKIPMFRLYVPRYNVGMQHIRQRQYSSSCLSRVLDIVLHRHG